MKVFLRGGLGNQLFQYSAGKYLSRKQATEVEFRTDLLPPAADSIAGVSRWPSQLSEFSNNEIVWCKKNQPDGATHVLSKFLQAIRMLGDLFPSLFLRFGLLVGEKNSAPDLSHLPRLWLIDSYCSSSLPARNLGDELRHEITSIKNPSPKFLEHSKEASEVDPIVVHIRLGDYRNLKHLYGEPDFSRIASLLNEVNPAHKEPVWLFSDSPQDIDEKAKKELGVTNVFGPGDLKRPIENMVLMSRGSVLICSNSTFSWWAAFLKGDKGKVYYPESEGLPNRIFSGDLVLDGWKAF